MPAGGTRIPWIVIGVLIVAMAGAGIAAKKKKTDPVKTSGSRAAVVPTADRARTVVVPPCSPPTVINAANASSQIEVPGAVAVTLPVGEPTHTVVVPRCQAKAAPAPGSANLPSAAFVLDPGEQVSAEDKTPAKGNPVASGIKAQVTLPTGSEVTTVIVPPCQGEAKEVKTTVLNPLKGTTVAVAPGC